MDECHRGSAGEDSNWREILEYFSDAIQLGMTATPRRADNRDTYDYFGAPLVEYSLADGIEDGFLAPFQVFRIVTDVDAAGWRPRIREVDRYGEPVPDRLYGTADFDRTLVLSQRTRAIASDLVAHLEASDPYAKTIVFCVDQEHASAMRAAIASASRSRLVDDPDYVVRITSDEGDIGRTYLENFMDVDRRTPAIATTSDMLTTGVDAPTVKNIVLVRSINSMSTFKQIIGRGTRLRTDYNKWYFTIHDYTGVATELFADPEFDGFPFDVVHEEVPMSDADQDLADIGPANAPPTGYEGLLAAEDANTRRRKYYVDDAHVEIAAEVVYHLDADGRRLRATSYTDYVGEQVRTLVRDQDEIRNRWIDERYRSDLVEELRARGIDPEDLLQATEPDADPFDLLCNVAFGTPVRKRRDRSAATRAVATFWEKYPSQAREVLELLLEKYEQYGIAELVLPEALEVPPLSDLGNVVEIASRFGGPAQLREAVLELQECLYAA